jgi:hypothetical protein
VCLPFLDENGTLACKGFSAPCPLYGLTDLIARPDAPVLVVEGEATADVGAKLFPDGDKPRWIQCIRQERLVATERPARGDLA